MLFSSLDRKSVRTLCINSSCSTLSAVKNNFDAQCFLSYDSSYTPVITQLFWHGTDVAGKGGQLKGKSFAYHFLMISIFLIKKLIIKCLSN